MRAPGVKRIRKKRKKGLVRRMIGGKENPGRSTEAANQKKQDKRKKNHRGEGIRDPEGCSQ